MKTKHLTYLFETNFIWGKLSLFTLGLFLSHFSYGTAVPVADFFADKTNVFAADTIQLTDLSTNIPTAWSWSFPGGSPATSTLQNPQVVYVNPGVYSITLTATNSGGASTPVTKTNYLTVNDASVGNDNASLVALTSPKMVDPGTHDVKVRLRNMGENIINTVNISWELNGVLQTPVTWVHPLDTINGLTARDTVVTLGTINMLADSITSFRAWTSAPNTNTDSQTSNDTITSKLRTKLSGTYTIGGTNPDFATIGAAVRGLKVDYGIGGPVVFNIRNGVYNESVSIDGIAGTSATNTVVFKSENNDASLVTLTYAPTTVLNNYTIEVKNSNYISFKNVTITSAGTTYARAFVITGTSSFLNVQNCTLSTIANTGTANTIAAVFGTSLLGSNISFKNNVISGGSSGLYLSGTSTTSLIGTGLIIDSNTFSGSGYYPVYVYYANAPKFRYNNVTIANPTYSTIYPATFGYCDNGLEVTNNKMSGTALTATVYGLRIYYSDGSASNYAKVNNNELTFQTSGTLYGCLYSYYSSYVEYYHNSIHGLSTGATNYAAYFYHANATESNIIVRNNIFANTSSTGYALFVYNPLYINSNYNLIYSTSPTTVYKGLATVASYNTLSAYRVDFPTQERNSFSYRPAFTSNTNLQPNIADTASWLLNGMGIHTYLNADILGNARPTVALNGAPDLGAYQFTPAANAPRATAQPATPIPGQTQAFMYGSDTLATIEWDIASAYPSALEMKNYSDSAIAVYPAEFQLRSFLDIDMSPPGVYLYNLKYFYKTPLLGNIVNEQDLIGAKQASNTWFFFNGSSTILDTLNNTLKVSFLTENTFKLTGTDNFLPLPVRLGSFAANVYKGSVSLDWTTVSETNNSGFEVERSVDGNTFGYVGSVKGAGNSSRSVNYTLTDAEAFAEAGSNVLYYRLKQMDFDGNSEYSQIVRVSKDAIEGNALSVYPNPYTSDFTVSFTATNNGTASIEVLDLQGRVVATQNTSVVNGSNTISVLESTNLKSGIYFVRLNINGETQTLKLVKN